MGSAQTAPRDDRDHRSHHEHGEQSRQLPSVSLHEAGHDAFVVVAAIEQSVDQRDRENAVAGPAQEHPSINRTIAQTMSSVTSAVVSEPIEKLPMKCSGMWTSANGTAVRSAAVTRP